MERWDTDQASMFWFLVPGVVVPAVLLGLAFWQPTTRQVLRWGAVCDVVITDANREQVRHHLGRVRRYRSLAAFPFWWLMSIRLVYADFPAAFVSPLPALAAYVVGGLLAELTSAPASPGAVRRAPLLARSVGDYVPRWARVLPWALIAGGAGATLLGRDVDGPTSTHRAAGVVVLAALVAAAAELVGWRLVRRAQRGSDPDVLAADDGLRAAGISSAEAAAGLAGLVGSVDRRRCGHAGGHGLGRGVGPRAGPGRPGDRHRAAVLHRAPGDVGIPTAAPAAGAGGGLGVIISVDPADREPPYQQIRLQVLAAATTGGLPEGTRLPTIRQLADDLDLATGTVARAYRELEADGVIEARGRRGTFVRGPAPTGTLAAARTSQLDDAARAWVAEARRIGVSVPEIAAAVARALAAPI